MKWGNIIYTGRNTINIGDVLLLLTVNHIYELMGIKQHEIIRINYGELGKYDGEAVILPIVSAFMGYHDGRHITCYSDKIIPVFLSLNIYTTVLNEEDVEYLKKYGPIGCRDWQTYETMCKYNISAYLNGCLSITMKFREVNERKYQNILCVDVPSELESFIPLDYRNDIKHCSQILSMEGVQRDCVEQLVYKQYLSYLEDARLVITSRLHCAIPCMMAGIPVVFAGKEFVYRFSWMEKYIRFYSQDEYSSIDWTGESSVNHELYGIRDDMIRFVISRLLYSKSYWEYNLKMPTVFCKLRNYKVYALEKIKEDIDNKVGDLSHDGLRIAIWGMGQISDIIYDYIVNKYETSVFIGMFDRKISGEYGGVKIQDPAKLYESECNLVIITPITIVGEEKEKIRKNFESIHKENIFVTDYLEIK